DHVLFKVAGQIDADDLGTQGSRQWTNLDVSIGTHRPSSPLTARASPCTQRHPRELAAGATGPPGFPPHRRARRDHAPCLRPPPEVPPRKVNPTADYGRVPPDGCSKRMGGSNLAEVGRTAPPTCGQCWFASGWPTEHFHLRSSPLPRPMRRMRWSASPKRG